MINRSDFKNLVATQFLTVFNDNLFKQSVLLIAVSHAASFPEMQSWAQALFSAPFFLFAAFAGDLADRFSKRNLIVICKHIEAAIMLMAAIAFYWQSNFALLTTVALMGTQSAFLGPAKYGAIREYCSTSQLANANGIFQTSVLLAILLGTGSAGHIPSNWQWLLGIIMAATSLFGARVAMKMSVVDISARDQLSSSFHFNPFKKLLSGLRFAKRFKGLVPAIIGHSIFWLCGSWMLLAWNEFLVPTASAPARVELSAGIWSLGLASLSIFMGIGALISGHLCTGCIKRSTPVFGGVGMAIGLTCAGLFGQSPLSIWASLALASFFSGFYLIPLRSLVQFLSPTDSLGSTLGLNQMLDFGLILIASVIRPWLMTHSIDANSLLIIGAAVMLMSCTALSLWLPPKTKLIDTQHHA
ncbi:MAG: MFS transporter [Planctomycetes bacterium]|nr:MFS transporter [Planctomycetota bacterium]